MLAKYLCLRTNRLEQDHNGTRIATVCKIFRFALRVKRGLAEHYQQFNADPFLLENEWKTHRKF